MAILDSVERLRGALDYHLARHNILTANLAHLDTPGYKALDLARVPPNENFRTVLEGVGGAGGTEGASLGARGWEIREAREESVGFDDNAVSLDAEAVKIADNQMRYDFVAQLASSELAGLTWAANDGRSG